MSDRFGVTRYLAVRWATSPAFAPDGRELAFVTNVTGVPEVWRVPAEGGWPEQVTFSGERVEQVEWSPRGDLLVFTMDAGGNERMQVYVVDPDGTRPRCLTRDPQAMHRLGGFSPDGSLLAYSGNERDARFFDVYVQGTDASSARRVLQSDDIWTPVRWTPDGRALLLSRMNTNLDNDLFLLDLDGGGLRHLTPHADEAHFASPCFTPDGRALYLTTNRDREFAALARLDLASGALEILAAPEADVELVRLDPGGRWLFYAVNAGGASDVHLLDLATAREVPLPSLPLGVVADARWSPDGSRLALVVDGPQHPPDVWLLDPAAGQVRQVTRSSLAGIPRASLAVPRLVRCPSFDGLEVPAWLYVPEGGRPDGSLPAVVHVHGGPESQARAQFNPVIQYLVNRGYVVLAPNVRGSTGYGRTYVHLDDRRKRWDAAADLKACWEWLVSSGWAHPRRVAVMGGSYGGFMVLASVTTYPELWAAGVDIVGIANFETFLERTHPARRPLREAEYGSLAEDREWFRQVSPIYHVERIRAPLMVIHGANDPRVPVEEAEQIVGRLRELGRPVEYLRFEDEGHGVVKLPNRIRAYTAVAEFLDRHLLGGAAGALAL